MWDKVRQIRRTKQGKAIKVKRMLIQKKIHQKKGKSDMKHFTDGEVKNNRMSSIWGKWFVTEKIKNKRKIEKRNRHILHKKW